MFSVVHPVIVKTIVWSDEAATQRFAATLASQSELHNALIELRGDLGAGKTTLVRHLLHALGVSGRIKSPTYAVVEPYTLRLPDPSAPGAGAGELAIWHFDFYRLNDPREWEDAGFRDIFASPGLKLAEWPEKAAGFLPRADLVIGLEALDEDARKVTLSAQSEIGVALLQAVSEGNP